MKGMRRRGRINDLYPSLQLQTWVVWQEIDLEIISIRTQASGFTRRGSSYTRGRRERLWQSTFVKKKRSAFQSKWNNREESHCEYRHSSSRLCGLGNGRRGGEKESRGEEQTGGQEGEETSLQNEERLWSLDSFIISVLSLPPFIQEIHLHLLPAAPHSNVLPQHEGPGFKLSEPFCANVLTQCGDGVRQRSLPVITNTHVNPFWFSSLSQHTLTKAVQERLVFPPVKWMFCKCYDLQKHTSSKRKKKQ